ncbi:hypothetical protein THRCLA_02539 [Thraustotheca clavata]|uniref:Vacuolar sorting receptor thioredoxin-like domain-containing protein n=1 Tax=Thraustotheca clavata TaxID=74557 RepID=A0A1W0A4V4_9STRA|nr:hypothetical protein THRCLA_02539 [Thraustotheca clavata]
MRVDKAYVFLFGILNVFQVVAEFVVVTPSDAIDYEIPYKTLTKQTLLRGKLMAPLVSASTIINSSIIDTKLDNCPPISVPTETLSEYHLILAEIEPGCTIFERIQQIQHLGAVGAVLYNATLDNITDYKPLVGLAIPAIIVGANDALKLQQIAKNDTIVAMLRWITPHPHSSVNLNLYFAASTGLNSELDGFHTLLNELGSVVKFTPHFEMYKASEWGCSNITENPECDTLCDGIACTFDPEDDFTLGHNGSEILYYAATQWCLNQHTNKYWQFMSQFQSSCTDRNIVDCIDSTLITMKLPTVQSCIKYNRTEFYTSEMVNAYSAGVSSYPLVTVNDQPLYGDWHCNEPITMSSCEPLQMVCRYINYANISVPDGKCTPQYWTSRCVHPREIDECGICTIRDSPNWNNACLGCDGIANSNKTLDMCGVCGGDGSFDMCGECLPHNDSMRNTICADCHGEPWGGAKVDICGVCGGHGSIDACGLCFEADDPRRQNYGCQIELDPEAMRLKLYIEGMSTEAFVHKDTVRGFISTLADVTVTKSENVHIKSIESVGAAVVVNVFLLPNNGSFKHATIFQTMDLNTLFANTNWNHGSKPLKITLLAANDCQTTTTNNSIPVWWYIGGGSGLICSMTITTWLIQRRDRRMKKDMHQLFSKYTPLVSLEDEF